jgi:glycosyltransferase involved in cell wall biosynthesis
MPQIYRDNDIYISATEQEGMSNAMLEAMASGLPIVTTRAEGIDELIADNGTVVDDPTPDTIAAAIVDIATNPQRYAHMAAAARKKAQSLSWTQTAKAYLNLYSQISATQA